MASKKRLRLTNHVLLQIVAIIFANKVVWFVDHGIPLFGVYPFSQQTRELDDRDLSHSGILTRFRCICQFLSFLVFVVIEAVRFLKFLIVGRCSQLFCRSRCG